MKTIIACFLISISCFSCATVILPPVRNPGIAESNLPPKTYIQLVKTTKATELKEGYFAGHESGPAYNAVFDFYGGIKPEFSNFRERLADAGLGMLTGNDPSLDPNYPNDVANRNGFNVYGFSDKDPSFPKMKYFLAQAYPIVWQHHNILVGYSDLDRIFIYYDASTGAFENISYEKINESTEHGHYYSVYTWGIVLFPKVSDANTLADKQPAGQGTKPPSGKVDLSIDHKVSPPEKPRVPIAVTAPQSTGNVTVTWTSANIRSGAGYEFPVLATVKQGERLTLIGEYGEWFNIRLGDGKDGWINNIAVK